MKHKVRGFFIDNVSYPTPALNTVMKMRKNQTKMQARITPHFALRTPYSLLPLRQAIRFFVPPAIQQLQRANLEIPAQAYVQPDHILLVQR